MTIISTTKTRSRRFCPPPTPGIEGSEFMNRELIESKTNNIAPFIIKASEPSFLPFLTPNASNVKIIKNIAIKNIAMLPNCDHKSCINAPFEAAKKAKDKDIRKLTGLLLKILTRFNDPNTIANTNRNGIKNCSD
jgi:hypothetical protein